MKVKFCYQCGAPLEGDGKVCTSCGTTIEENNSAEESKKVVKKEKKTWDSKKHTVPAVIWTLFLALFACLAAALYSAGSLVKEDNLLNFVQNVEWMDIEMETITDGENLYDTLGETAFSYVKYYTTTAFGFDYYALTEETFEELVGEDFFQEYIVELVLRYADAVKEQNYKKGALKLEDISDFLDKNERKINKIFGDGFAGYCTRFLEQYGERYTDEIEDTEELLCLNTYKKDLKTVFTLASYFLNDYFCYIFLGLSLVLLIVLIVLKRSRCMGYVGSAFLLSGGLLLAARIFLLNTAEKLEAPYHLNVDVLPVFLASFSKMSILLVIAFFAVALVSIILSRVIRRK